jgi:putative NADH-flavin reductase
MKLTILGATGGVGRELVTQGLERGHTLTALVRPSTSAAHDSRVCIVPGEVYRGEGLDEALAHADAVLCALGMKRKNPKNPWSKNTSPDDFMQVSTRHIIEAMKRAKVSRIIAVSAAGVGDSRARLNLVMRFFLATTMIGTAYRDLEQMELLLAESGLDWLTPRPTRLTWKSHGRVVVTERFGTNDSIGRSDVARWILDALERPDIRERTPQITAR